MKIKVFAFIFSTFIGIFAANAQEATLVEGKRNEHQIGLNATQFFKQFINFGGNANIPISPYLFSYKILNRKNLLAFRSGLGLAIAQNKQNTDQSTFTGNSIALDGRLGFEKQFNLHKRWDVWAGFDVPFNLLNEKSSTNNPNFDRVTLTNRFNYGYGPVFGIQWNITNRISLFTEASLYVFHGKEKVTINESNNSESPFESSTTLNTFSMQFAAPTSVHFNVKF